MASRRPSFMVEMTFPYIYYECERHEKITAAITLIKKMNLPSFQLETYIIEKIIEDLNNGKNPAFLVEAFNSKTFLTFEK